MSKNLSLERYWTGSTRRVDRALGRVLPKESVRPFTLHRAMRYSVFSGGKRLRPVLALAACEACGVEAEAAMPSACAVELIHAYSLVHDDLPCMDDDDLRRGRPTCHKAFGEGVAVLAGDALLTLAFEVLSGQRDTGPYKSADFVRVLAGAAGSRFLVGGQSADLEGENQKLNRKELKFIHEGKTAAMIVASLQLGGMSAGATKTKLESLRSFGLHLGLAFQVVDDILDVTQTSQQLGKTSGKDAKAGKNTYPGLLGLDGARKEAGRLTRLAMKSLAGLEPRAARLREIADYLLQRKY
jgi:geranylgeranyl diphosphate synthase type II